MNWRKWRAGLAIAGASALLTAGLSLTDEMNGRAFLRVLCASFLTVGGAYLKTHPVEDVNDEK